MNCFRVFDYDTYSSHDAIGKVYFDLKPLLTGCTDTISGWFPIYDTLHGQLSTASKLFVVLQDN